MIRHGKPILINIIILSDAKVLDRYDYTKGVSNLAGRPHALTIWGAKKSVFEGLRFVQSQMW